jgi:hypothetical protein
MDEDVDLNIKLAKDHINRFWDIRVKYICAKYVKLLLKFEKK